MLDTGRHSAVELPTGTSDLTCHPLEDFEATDEWVELAQLPVKSDADGFWHCMRQWTHELHWNRTIWKISMEQQAFSRNQRRRRLESEHDGETACTENDSNLEVPTVPEIFVGPPPDGYRWSSCRILHRKTPAPVGGGIDGSGPSHTVVEWTAQYVSDEGDRHTAVFGLAIPESARAGDNLRALTYWPFQYPKVRAFSLTFELNHKADADDAKADCPGLLRYRVIPLSDKVCSSGRDFEATRVHASKSALRILNECRKRAERYDPTIGDSSYVKRVVHDMVVDEELYRKHYDKLKVKYGTFWAANWPEVTDPVKFVYEELAIAAYLISLFETERQDSDVKQSFVDLGCGNGFLTYLLLEEGYRGKGVDINRRGIWNMYPDHVSQCLVQETIEPESYTCSEVDWIIGNHSDELTPWIPAIAARSQRQEYTSTSTLAGPKFFLLPCCFYDFDKKKFAFSSMRRSLAVPDIGEGKYAQYLNYIERICVAFGFGVDGVIERENMRIPSTKYVALLGRSIQDRARTRPETVSEIVKIATWDAQMSHT